VRPRHTLLSKHFIKTSLPCASTLLRNAKQVQNPFVCCWCNARQNIFLLASISSNVYPIFSYPNLGCLQLMWSINISGNDGSRLKSIFHWTGIQHGNPTSTTVKMLLCKSKQSEFGRSNKLLHYLSLVKYDEQSKTMMYMCCLFCMLVLFNITWNKKVQT